MKVLFALLIALTHWYYVPSSSPSVPVEIEKIDLNLKNEELAVTFLSLSDGEATLLQHANGENILINTGGVGTELELKKLLQLYGVTKISTVILTKDDPCCYENLFSLFKEYDVKQLISGEKVIKNLEADIEQQEDVSYHVWTVGTKQQILPGLNTEVLFEGSEINEGLDLSLTFLRHRILYLTSSSDLAKDKLLKYNLADVNIVKIPQFAKEHSITDKLIKHMDPQIAVIFQSKVDKPSANLFELLQEAWIDVYFTKKHGTITMKFTDINYEVITISPESEMK